MYFWENNASPPPTPLSNDFVEKILTRTYMHAETLRLADKTIVFNEHEVFKVVVMVTR
jgi:hypothetical protein